MSNSSDRIKDRRQRSQYTLKTSRRKTLLIRNISLFAYLCCLLLLAFWIRIQGMENIPKGNFTETDGYFYYWQASLISEQGHLPERDMHRWLPLGRDLGQTLNLYGYVLAYTHKVVSSVFGNVPLYHVCLYMPVVCFCIGLSILCLYLYHTYGLLFSSIVGILLATLPGSIERSTAGFGDRDAFCLMLGILAVVTYLASLETETPRKRLFWTLASGFTVFLGGISWEGFGVFLSVIIVVELWRFLMTETEDRLGLYAVWVCCFVPTLYLASPAYRRGYGFSEHLAAFVLLPPIILLAMRVIRSLLISKVDRLRPHIRTVSLGLILASATLALGYVWIQQNTFADTTVPISNSPVMQAMTELRSPHYNYWVARYGTVFIVGSLGFILIPVIFWKQQGIPFSIPIALFTLFSFFRQPLDKIWGEPFGNALFGIALVGCAIGFLLLAWKKKNKAATSELIFIAFALWFIAWVALARDAKRYDFFIGVPLAYGSAVLLGWISELLSERFGLMIGITEHLKTVILKNGVAVILLTCLIFLPINHAHTYRSLYATKGMRKAMPTPIVAKALSWMKEGLPSTAVVAANWGYGSQLNVLGGVKTVTDQDTYIQHWIELYYKHVIHAKTESEALEYLKTHDATHLMLVGHNPARHFLKGHLSAAFVPIYPKENFTEAHVNIWELHYPPDIKANPKYLKTGFPEIDDHLPLQ